MLVLQVSGLSSINEQKKCLCAPFALAPTTSSGVDQAPNQRLFFRIYCPSLSRAFFHLGTLHFRLSGQLIFALFLPKAD